MKNEFAHSLTHNLKREYFLILDLSKILCCILIVAIHSEMSSSILYPWFRIAVPLFFLITAFLFFTKIKDLDRGAQLFELKKYIKRNLLLYLFYFILTIPIVFLFTKRYFFEQNIVQGFLSLLLDFIFNSTFPGSWFIMACIIDVPLVFLLSKKTNYIFLVVLGTMLYSITVLFSPTYSFLFPNSQIVIFIRENIISLEFSFVSGLVWIILGKVLAEKKIVIGRETSFCGALCFIPILYFEYSNVKYLNGSSIADYDVYFGLLPFCFFIFCFLISFNGSYKANKTFVILRNCSIIVYATHIIVISAIKYILNYLNVYYSSLVVFLLTIAVCFLSGVIIQKLEKIKLLKWLRFSH